MALVVYVLQSGNEVEPTVYREECTLERRKFEVIYGVRR